MGHSQVEKAKSRERILEVAARQIREGGLESVSISELMKQANLTHGGFYGHFPSRDALIAAALERAIDAGESTFAAAESGRAPGTVKSTLNRYLSVAHRDNAGAGCAFGALIGDAARSKAPEVRALVADRLEDSLERMTHSFGDGPGADEAAMVALCTMLGAISVARVFKDRPESEAILKAARQSILDLEARQRAEV